MWPGLQKGSYSLSELLEEIIKNHKIVFVNYPTQ